MPSPRDGRGWAVSGVREMLYRELYRGVVIWNRSQKVVRGGTKKQRRRETDERLRVDAPDQRIVSDELWQRVHSRLDKARELMPRSFHGGRLLGRPPYLDGESRCLLTGFTKCSICGGRLVQSRGHTGSGRTATASTITAASRTTGAVPRSAPTRRTSAKKLLDRAVIAGINRVLDERVLELAVEKELVRLRSGQMEQLDRRTQITRELSLIKAKEKRLVEAIKRGDAVEPRVEALKAEEERKTALTRELETVGAVEKIASQMSEAYSGGESRRRVRCSESFLHGST